MDDVERRLLWTGWLVGGLARNCEVPAPREICT
jgi:hypothetical protein